MENIFGLSASVLGIFGAAVYIKDTYQRKTLPHRFAWFIFLIISIISFASQYELGARSSLFFAGWFICNNIIIFSLSLREKGGHGGITTINIIGLALALVGILFWIVLSSPLAALLSVLAAEIIGATMIVFKIYKAPQSETLVMWATGIVASGLNILAVGKLDFALLAFPTYLFIANCAIVLAALLGVRAGNKILNS